MDNHFEDLTGTELKYIGQNRKFILLIFNFLHVSCNFKPQKMKKKNVTQNFEISSPYQIAQIQNFEILTSQDDYTYLEDSFLRNSLSS